jgi:hypothetical protein
MVIPLDPVALAGEAYRFWSCVDTTGPVVRPELGPCWVWTANRNTLGYGVFCFLAKKLRANRVSWTLTRGPIPDGHGVLHKCDNPPCVRPEHLFTGTQRDNLLDCARKGRVRSYPSLAWQVSARNRSTKPNCKHGHPLSGDNLRLTAAGYRRCRTCLRALQKKYRGPTITRAEVVALAVAACRARAEARTHCRRGHALTPGNVSTYSKGSPHKLCKTCHRDKERARLQHLRAAKATTTPVTHEGGIE